MMLITASFFWGSTFLFTKKLIFDMPVYSIIFGRSIIAGSVLFIVYFKTIRKEFKRAFFNKLIWLFALSETLALSLQTEGLRFTTATNSAFITTLFIVFIPFIKIYIYKEKIKLHLWIAVFLALIGLYTISFGFSFPNTANPGDMLTIICAFFYSLSILALEKISKEFSGGTIIFFYFIIQTITSFLILLKVGNIDIFLSLNIHSYTYLISLGIFGSACAFLLMATGQKYVSAQVASIIYNLEPVSATFLAFLFLNEAMTIHKITGCILIFSALIVGTKK